MGLSGVVLKDPFGLEPGFVCSKILQKLCIEKKFNLKNS